MKSFSINNFHYFLSSSEDEKYELEVLTKMQSRRMTEIGKVAIDLALKSSVETEIDFVVYASRHGEVQLSHDLIKSILASEIPSPMKFSGSTHNSVIGLYSIITKNKSAMTALSHGEDSFIMGMVCALNYLLSHPKKNVMFIFCDGMVPKIYGPKLSEPNQNVVMSMVLSLGGDYSLEFSDSESKIEVLQSVDFLNWFNNKTSSSQNFGPYKVTRAL